MPGKNDNIPDVIDWFERSLNRPENRKIKSTYANVAKSNDSFSKKTVLILNPKE